MLDGILYLASVPTTHHQRSSMNLALEFARQITDPSLGTVFYAPLAVMMPFADPVQPDLLVVLAEHEEIITERNIVGVPALLVEILSPSNAAYDLTIKADLYARAGVPEYWVVRPDERDILVHSLPEPASGRYLQVQHVAPDGELRSPTLPFSAPIAPFFATSRQRAD